MATVVLDAGHGGSDPGAVYNGRQEKDDVLRLAKAVGSILENNGVNVQYTRTNDIYDTPFQKAVKANATGADLLISIHRNSGANPNTYNGAQTLVYSDDGIRATLARNINNELTSLGFRDAGIVERPNLVVLKRSSMPAALVEVGFINNDADNRLFDEKFNEIAQGIADGILTTLYGGQGGANDARAVETTASANNDFIDREFETGEQTEYNNMMG
ncbi:MAG: N-acetylmuramoyl-L-alanine amidase, partial [Alistipes sp.]|nr:N-acetylmuramoyl-L-alanine amidase [Alistipes sp.]